MQFRAALISHTKIIAISFVVVMTVDEVVASRGRGSIGGPHHLGSFAVHAEVDQLHLDSLVAVPHKHGDALVVVLNRQVAIGCQQVQGPVVGSREVGRGDRAPHVVPGMLFHGGTSDETSHSMRDIAHWLPIATSRMHHQIKSLYSFQRLLLSTIINILRVKWITLSDLKSVHALDTVEGLLKIRHMSVRNTINISSRPLESVCHRAL